MGAYNVVLAFKFLDEILWCDHSNETFKPFGTETSSTVPLNGTICFSKFYEMKFVILLEI